MKRFVRWLCNGEIVNTNNRNQCSAGQPSYVKPGIFDAKLNRVSHDLLYVCVGDTWDEARWWYVQCYSSIGEQGRGKKKLGVIFFLALPSLLNIPGNSVYISVTSVPMFGTFAFKRNVSVRLRRYRVPKVSCSHVRMCVKIPYVNKWEKTMSCILWFFFFTTPQTHPTVTGATTEKHIIITIITCVLPLASFTLTHSHYYYYYNYFILCSFYVLTCVFIASRNGTVLRTSRGRCITPVVNTVTFVATDVSLNISNLEMRTRVHVRLADGLISFWQHDQNAIFMQRCADTKYIFKKRPVERIL